MKQQAQMAIEQEMKAARRRLQEEITNLTVQLAEKMLVGSIRPSDQEKLVEEYIERLRRMS